MVYKMIIHGGFFTTGLVFKYHQLRVGTLLSSVTVEVPNSRKSQEKIAPVVMERAGQASEIVQVWRCRGRKFLPSKAIGENLVPLKLGG